MKKPLLVAGLILILLLSACSSATPTVNSPASTNGTDNNSQNPYPAQQSSYPATTTDQNTQSVSPAVAYPIEAGDDAMQRGTFAVDKVELRANSQNTNLVDVWVSGTLPTSCDHLRVDAAPPDPSNNININVYTVSSKDETCAQSTLAFNGVIASLGGYPAGQYNIVVNGTSAGQVTMK